MKSIVWIYILRLLFFKLKYTWKFLLKVIRKKPGPNTDHGPDTGFYGPYVNQSESRIPQCQIIIAAERQRGSTLFLTTPANRLVTCATYISSKISISVIRSVGADVAFPGGEAVSKHGGSTKNTLTWYAHASAFDFHVVKFWSSA